MKLRWTQTAADDLQNIKSYIAKDSTVYADAVIDRIFDCANRLTSFPESGHIVPEYERDDIREVFVHSYRLIYLVTVNEIRMLTIIHGSRLLSNTPPG